MAFRSRKSSSGHSNAGLKTCGRTSFSRGTSTENSTARKQSNVSVRRKSRERERKVVEKDVDWF
ncbi:hypothetical protein C473_08282 [Halorubrum distributum JCM 10247]|uniref:Uncharacterized protein n=1 Tax=Halorubrum distributum JCM 10247 TaxID=1227486 RepID=M0DB16_9EURY|nr:hypothetical protein C473_08282 [Halorubrum terrestre JCM 10247]